MPNYQNFISTYKGFEEVVIFPEIHQNLYKIISQYSQIVLDLSDDEYDNEIADDNSALMILQNENPHCPPPKNAEGLFSEIYNDHSRVVDFPRDIFLLNLDDATCNSISSDYGVCVIPESNISFPRILSAKYKWYFEKDDQFSINGKVGWRCVMNGINVSPINSLVIIDNYMFQNSSIIRGVTKYWGEDNIVNFVDAIAPNNLKTDFHILLVTKNPGKGIPWIENLLSNITSEIQGLRRYDIKVGMVIHNNGDDYHQRCMISNYLFGDTQWGFGAFRNDIIWKKNHLSVSGNYLTINEIGDVDAKAANVNIRAIKDLIKTNNQLGDLETNLNRGFIANRMI